MVLIGIKYDLLTAKMTCFKLKILTLIETELKINNNE